MYIKLQTSKDLFVNFKKLKLDQNVFNCTSSLNVYLKLELDGIFETFLNTFGNISANA